MCELSDGNQLCGYDIQQSESHDQSRCVAIWVSPRLSRIRQWTDQLPVTGPLLWLLPKWCLCTTGAYRTIYMQRFGYVHFGPAGDCQHFDNVKMLMFNRNCKSRRHILWHCASSLWCWWHAANLDTRLDMGISVTILCCFDHHAKAIIMYPTMSIDVFSRNNLS